MGAWVGAVIAALSAAASAYQQSEVNKKQQDIAAANLRQQQEQQNKAQQRVNAQLQSFQEKPNAQQPTGESFLDQLIAAKGGQRYTPDKSLPAAVALDNERNAESAKDNATLGSIFETVNNAADQRRDEGFQMGRTNLDLARIGDHASQLAAAGRMELQGVHANPWLSGLLGAAQAYGMNKMVSGMNGSGIKGTTNWQPGYSTSLW